MVDKSQYKRKQKKVCAFINNTVGMFNFRGLLIKTLVHDGYDLVIVAQNDGLKEELESLGARIVEVNPSRHGTNPFADIRLLKTYKRILKEEKPSIVLTYNIKPSVYAGLACQSLKIPYIVNITGLGTPLEQKSKIQKISILLYRIGIKGASCVFFQNDGNRRFFEEHDMLSKNANTRVIPGSGVDLEKHPLLPYPEGDDVHFLFAARIRKEKGIDLYLAAAHKYASSTVHFDICGACEDPKYLEIFKNDECINYYGQQKDLTSFYAKCSCFLYPSYYPEGMSNVLLEAAASGRPVIAANRPGCKETVEDGVTGFLVPVNDTEAVFEATKKFLDMTIEQRTSMGLKGHEKAVREFDRNIVVDAYLEEIERVFEIKKKTYSMRNRKNENPV